MYPNAQIKQKGEITRVEATNVTRNMPMTASDTWNNIFSVYDASKVVDGNPATRWASNDNTKESWLKVNFGQSTTFHTAEMMEM